MDNGRRYKQAAQPEKVGAECGDTHGDGRPDFEQLAVERAHSQRRNGHSNASHGEFN